MSADVERALEHVLRAVVDGREVTDQLRSTLQAAARNARDRHLRAEDLLIAFKHIEQRLGVPLPDETGIETGRTRMVRILIEAYYGR